MRSKLGWGPNYPTSERGAQRVRLYTAAPAAVRVGRPRTGAREGAGGPDLPRNSVPFSRLDRRAVFQSACWRLRRLNHGRAVSGTGDGGGCCGSFANAVTIPVPESRRRCGRCREGIRRQPFAAPPSLPPSINPPSLPLRSRGWSDVDHDGMTAAGPGCWSCTGRMQRPVSARR